MRRGHAVWYLAIAAGIAVLLAAAIGANTLRGEVTAPDAASSTLSEEETVVYSSAKSEEFSVAETAGIDPGGLQEDKNVYNEDDPSSIVYFYVTVRYGTEERGTNHTFDEVKNAVRFVNSTHVENDIHAEALVQVGDEAGPTLGSLGYGETESNATIRVRGNSSTVMPQKSYKLSLEDSAGLWRGQSNIALNKHAFDATRIRNKLYFDLAKNLEDVPSLRTQFVRLFIKDETSGQTQFEDYGLYTQAEVPTKKYLANHGLDRSGFLYKAISFNWEPNEAIKNYDDPEYNAEAIEAAISSRGRQDNSRLMEMIDAVNDTSRDINEVIDTYFDRDNYMQWLAFNLLMGNRDTTMQNYYLYSPLNGSKFYFIPWDGDTSLMRYEYELEGGDGAAIADWEWGIGNYWGIILHQRFLKNERNRQELAEVVEEMHQWLNEETVNEMVAGYMETVSPYIFQMPDLLNLQHTPEEVETIAARMGDEVEENYQNFKDSLTDPMPFWMFEAELVDGQVVLSWDDAYDFEGAPMTYHLTVSRHTDMSDPLVDETDLLTTSYTVPLEVLGSGEYFWRVTATREDGAVAEAMNEVIIDDLYYLGIYNFTVEDLTPASSTENTDSTVSSEPASSGAASAENAQPEGGETP